MSILAKEEESEKLAKILERERRIQLSFQQVCLEIVRLCCICSMHLYDTFLRTKMSFAI